MEKAVEVKVEENLNYDGCVDDEKRNLDSKKINCLATKEGDALNGRNHESMETLRTILSSACLRNEPEQQ